MEALLIGGTGPTGPAILKELLARNYSVTILHRGTHEVDDAEVNGCPHIHADPHFFDSLTQALEGKYFDLCVATYGRLRVIADALVGHCDNFIGIGGNPAHPGMLDAYSLSPSGMKILARESDPSVLDLFSSEELEKNPRLSFAAKVTQAEKAVFQHHNAGHYKASYLRYPLVYGWRTWLQFERGVIARIQSGERRIVLPEGGYSVRTRAADRNCAHALGCLVDHFDSGAGEIFHCGDDDQYSDRQWCEMILSFLEVEAEIVSVPLAFAHTSEAFLPLGPAATPHTLLDTTKAKTVLGYFDVIKAKDALEEIVHRLAVDPSMASVAYDKEGERALLADLDAMRDSLLLRQGFDRHNPTASFSTWHPYDHPKSHEEPSRYKGPPPPSQYASPMRKEGARRGDL